MLFYTTIYVYVSLIKSILLSCLFAKKLIVSIEHFEKCIESYNKNTYFLNRFKFSMLFTLINFSSTHAK